MTSRSKKTLHAAEQDRPDVAAARAELKLEQSRLDAPRLVFIDETAVTTKMVRHRGRSPRGERLVASVPHGHWKTLTLVAALRINGLTAPYVIDGAMDGPSFLAYVEQILAPTLRKGDIVFMDNLRTHKIDGVRHAVEAVGAKVRYLPAYSPDLNPIEMAFSKLKKALRKGDLDRIGMIDRPIALAAAGFVIPRQHRDPLKQGGFAGAVFAGNDGDGTIEAQLKVVLEKRQAKWIGLAVGDARRIEPDPCQIRRRHVDGAISP